MPATQSDVTTGLATLGANGWSVNPFSSDDPRFSQVGQVSVALLGDSITQYNNRVLTVSSVDWGNGIATVTAASAHGLAQGVQIYYAGAGAAVLQGIRTVYSIISNTQFSFQIPMSLGSGSNASGSDVFSDMTNYWDSGFMTWANLFSNQRFNVVVNAGRGGDLARNIASRIAGEIAPFNPQLVFELSGINDCISSSSTPREIFEFRRAAWIELIKRGYTPVVQSIWPLGSGHPSFATATPRILQVNALTREYCLSDPRIFFVDSHSALVNSANGAALSTFNVLLSDNVHPTKLAGRIVGKLIADTLAMNSASLPLTTSALDNFGSNSANTNIFDWAPWTSSGGTVGTGVTGTAAQGHSIARLTGATSTAVASVVARTLATDGDALGFNQRLVVTPAAETSQFWDLMQNSENLRFVTGQSYEIRCFMRLSGVAAAPLSSFEINHQLAFIDSISGFSYNYVLRAIASAESVAPMAFTAPFANLSTADGQWFFRSRPFRIPTAVQSSTGLNFRFNFTAAGGSLTADYGRIGVHQVW